MLNVAARARDDEANHDATLDIAPGNLTVMTPAAIAAPATTGTAMIVVVRSSGRSPLSGARRSWSPSSTPSPSGARTVGSVVVDGIADVPSA